MGFVYGHRIFLTLVLTAVIPAYANWSSEEPQTRKHIVRPSETLSVIASSYGFEVNELARYNKLDATRPLRVGQVIYFPSDIPSVLSRNGSRPARPLDATKFPGATAPIDATRFPERPSPLDATRYSGEYNPLDLTRHSGTSLPLDATRYSGEYNPLDLTRHPGTSLPLDATRYSGEYNPLDLTRHSGTSLPLDATRYSGEYNPLDLTRHPGTSHPLDAQQFMDTDPGTLMAESQPDSSRADNNVTFDIDYNFIQKQKPVTPPLKADTESPQKPGLKSLLQQASNPPETDEKVEEAVREVIEELIGDDESPALKAFGVRPYAYFGSGESLSEVLQNFAASYYMPAIIAEDVVGEVNGKIGPLTPVDFLDHMANIYGFIWYFDGHTLFVYDDSATAQKIISLGYLTVDQFKNTLKKIGIWDGRFFWRSQAKEGLVFISGPPRYIELVSQTALLLDAKEGERQKSKLTVRTFPLKYAWATDKSFTFRGQQLVVPGVATILKKIIVGGGVAQVTRSTLPNPSVKPVQSVTQSDSNKASDNKQENEQEQLNAGPKADAVYINADPRLNAVIVHDLESKMEMYEELIASLDKPTSQIEISVSIIDINTEDLNALGVDWNRKTSDIREFSFNPGNAGLDEKFASYTTIVQAGLGSFNATLSLLEDEGKVKVVSRPSILTMDNLEAILDNSSTFYVSVASNEDSELFPVTSGTVVQVTPRIVREEQGRRIHMSVNIQDGSGSQGGEGQAVGQKLPEVTNSSISTQAIISEQESLLVGGFYKERDEKLSSKIPLLGDIPVLGHLFKAEKNQKTKQVRLFLITPRIIGIERT